MRGSQQLGQDGEELATQHLIRLGLVVLDRNWRCREGELDIVAVEPDGTCVFCEVKTRSTARFGEPSEAVGPVKARRIRGLALRWLRDPSRAARVPAAVRRRLRRTTAGLGT